MSHSPNPQCAGCICVRHCLNGAYCELKRRYVEYEPKPLCAAPPTGNETNQKRNDE